MGQYNIKLLFMFRMIQFLALFETVMVDHLFILEQMLMISEYTK